MEEASRGRYLPVKSPSESEGSTPYNFGEAFACPTWSLGAVRAVVGGHVETDQIRVSVRIRHAVSRIISRLAQEKLPCERPFTNPRSRTSRG
jgi:hypothetical protein